MASSQSTNRIIMIRPACFRFNPQTIVGPFQEVRYTDPSLSDKSQQQALIEFDRMVEQLRSHDTHVDVFDDTPSPIKPDAVFPNNWFTTHPDGTITLYPMLEENRRPERRDDIIKKLVPTHKVTAVIDLSAYEYRNQFLEGTGSLVLDRVNKIVYAGRSPHTHENILEHVTRLIGYKQPPILSDILDDNQRPVYHTNVAMAIGTYFAVICLDSIPVQEQRDLVVKSLEQNKQRKVVDITFDQMKHFAGNMLEVQNTQGQYLLAMSKTAYESLTEEQRSTIEKTNTKLIYFDTSIIERCSGGSVRCMIAGNFLPQHI